MCTGKVGNKTSLQYINDLREEQHHDYTPLKTRKSLLSKIFSGM